MLPPCQSRSIHVVVDSRNQRLVKTSSIARGDFVTSVGILTSGRTGFVRAKMKYERMYHLQAPQKPIASPTVRLIGSVMMIHPHTRAGKSGTSAAPAPSKPRKINVRRVPREMPRLPAWYTHSCGGNHASKPFGSP